MATKKAPKVKSKATDVNVVNEVKIKDPYNEDKRGSLCVKEMELSAIKDWKIGQKYTLSLEVEMVGASKMGAWSDTPDKISADFKINKVSTDTKK